MSNVQLTKDEFATSDPTLLHQPTTDAEEALKEEVLQNVSLTYGMMRDQLSTFPVNQAVLGIFMNHRMWALLHFNRDGEELPRILKNHEVRKVQTIIETVQARYLNGLTAASGVSRQSAESTQVQEAQKGSRPLGTLTVNIVIGLALDVQDQDVT